MMKNDNFPLIAELLFLLCILLIIFVPYARTAAKDDFLLPLKSTGNVSFFADVYQFAKIGGGNRTEICYAVDVAQFVPEQSSKRDGAEFYIELTMTSPAGDTLYYHNERKSITLDSSFCQNPLSFIDLKFMELKTDSVDLLLQVGNDGMNLAGMLHHRFAVKKYPSGLSISDLYFASRVARADGKSNFEKHGLLMVPNPSRVFTHTEQTPNAYVYFEINNLSGGRRTPSSYSVSYRIENLAGVEIASRMHPAISTASSNTSRIEIIPLKSLKPGLYLLTMNITDLRTHAHCFSSRYFTAHQIGTSNDLVLSMTDEDIDRYYDQIKYIATHDEKELFKKLNRRGKQAFLLNFWKTRDPDPRTPENEFMQEFFSRYQYAREKFSGGINSDMARIYIQYGKPIDIKRQFSTAGYNKPVEIWYYSLNGTTEFVFVDRSGDGHYVLVHSTHPDEYQNPNWMDDLK